MAKASPWGRPTELTSSESAEFKSRFPTEERCTDNFTALRWPGGIIACPACWGSDDPWRVSRILWMCRSCGKQFSVTTRTPLHGTRSSIFQWYQTIWSVVSRGGISAHELQGHLGIPHGTAALRLDMLAGVAYPPSSRRLEGEVALTWVDLGSKKQAKRGLLVGEAEGRWRLWDTPAVAWTSDLSAFCHAWLTPGTPVLTTDDLLAASVAALGFPCHIGPPSYIEESLAGYDLVELGGRQGLSRRNWLRSTLRLMALQHEWPGWTDRWALFDELARRLAQTVLLA